MRNRLLKIFPASFPLPPQRATPIHAVYAEKLGCESLFTALIP